MSTLRAYLGTAGLTDVGYRFYTQNTAEGSRVTSGIVDEGDGWYSAAGVTLAGDHVRWDSTGTTDAVAREDLGLRLLVETIESRSAGGSLIVRSPVTVTAQKITAKRGDTWSITLTGLGDLSTVSDLYFAIKTKAGDADAAARLFASEDAGLTVVNGAAYGTSADAAVAIDSPASGGSVTITVQEAVTIQLTAGPRVFALKKKVSSTFTTLVEGAFEITEATILKVS